MTETIQDWFEHLALFKKLHDDSDIEKLTVQGQAIIKKFNNIVIIGTGGSTLTGQALWHMKNGLMNGSTDRTNLYFLDNLDPKTLKEKVLKLNFDSTFFIIISKSGHTMETLAQTLMITNEWSKHQNFSKHFLVITENNSSPLKELAKHYSWTVLDHPPDIGGRFSAFTVVGLLPCILLGLDPKKFKEGARNAIKNSESILHHIKKIHHYNQNILMAYSDYAQGLLMWQAQLIAESLGKKDINGHNQGITPIISRGTIDQHSQLQLWLDGPKKDRFFTIYLFKNKISLHHLKVDPILQHQKLKGLDHLNYTSIFNAQCYATVEALKKVGYLVYLKEYEQFDEFTMGKIMMEKIIETLTLAKHLKVNPFDQPAVELSKNLVRSYL